ncbi:MAG TPA: 2-phospho-L-lactate guanylyltransferase [Solirubrobacteraceae bacterium]|nr:2-phospho-L-lactate guanylyltransferase [Solirubrobacteraceae bacterium]
MMQTLAVLPIKSLSEAKQRLQQGLPPGPRRALAEAMFSDVLVSLRRTTAVEQILVVSDDHAAQQIAGGYGAAVLDDQREGHNAAASLAIQWAVESGFDRVLLVPGDCPLLNPGELDELIDRPAQTPSALIVPDRHGTGTNALLLTPPDALTPSFGPDSCRRHASLASEAGVAHEIVRVPSLALDIDTPEDLSALEAALAATRGGAAHTRGMLRQLLRSRS